MNRDDRLFAIIGGAVVAATTTIFLVAAGGITGFVDTSETVRVAPIPRAGAPSTSPGVVQASLEIDEPATDDQLVRSVIARVSAHPQWLTWMVTEDLMDRFVAAVEALADGYSPRDELDFLAPVRPFMVREEQNEFVIAAGTYRRFDLAVDVFASIDAQATVAIYRELEPMISEARQDVAWHRGDFEDRLRAAIDHLLEVEIPSGPIEVERRTVSYVFADDDLERLSDAQRQLLRLGTRNAAKVQDKLRAIRAAFQWPEPEPVPAVRRAVAEDGNGPDPVGETLIAEAVPVDEPDLGNATGGAASATVADEVSPTTEDGWAAAAPMLIDLDHVVVPFENTAP
jgi:hypothetical protein